MIGLLEKLIRVPSFSRDEAAAADIVYEWMQGLGLDVNRLGNNLWCASENISDKPTVLLNAHIDTVKPCAGWSQDPFSPTYDGDKLYGLGSNDDGGSLIALLSVYCKLCKEPQPYRLVFSATAAEEVTGVEGLEMILPSIGKVDLGIIGEPTKMRMAVAERGLMVLDCCARGISGHAARNEGKNAIYEALKSIEWFRNYQFEKVSQFLGPVKMTVTQINAGAQHNVVPDQCGFVVDVRTNGEYSNKQVLEIIKSGVDCEVRERSTRLESSSIAMDSQVVLRGLSLGLTAFGSPTASNQMVCPFPTLKIGPGDSARSHTADEYILLSEISQGIEIYYKLLNGLEVEV